MVFLVQMVQERPPYSNFLLEATRKAAEAPLEFSHSVIERSKKMHNPSPAAAKVETTIGGCIGGGLFLAGAVQLFTGSPLHAIGTASVGVVTIISNYVSYQKRKTRKASSTL